MTEQMKQHTEAPAFDADSTNVSVWAPRLRRLLHEQSELYAALERLEETRVACQAAYALFHSTKDQYNLQLEELESIRDQVSGAKHEREDADKLKV